MFKDILTCLVLDYRDASLITLYFVVLGISIKKSDQSEYISDENLLLKSQKSTCLKWTYGNSGYDYTVTMLSNYYRNYHAKFEFDRIILSFAFKNISVAIFISVYVLRLVFPLFFKSEAFL